MEMMNGALVETVVVAKLATVLAVPVMQGFDQSVDPGLAQVAVFAATEPMTMDAAGLPMDYRAMVRVMPVTHAVDDTGGAIRQGLRGYVTAWAGSVAKADLNVAGYTCDGVIGISDEESTDFGAEFISVGIRIDIAYQKA